MRDLDSPNTSMEYRFIEKVLHWCFDRTSRTTHSFMNSTSCPASLYHLQRISQEPSDWPSGLGLHSDPSTGTQQSQGLDGLFSR